MNDTTTTTGTHEEEALNRRMARAKQVFFDAEAFIRDAAAEGEIDMDGEMQGYLQTLTGLRPESTVLSAENVATWEAAVTAVRDAAISLWDDGDICHDGLNRFLTACRLETVPW